VLLRIAGYQRHMERLDELFANLAMHTAPSDRLGKSRRVLREAFKLWSRADEVEDEDAFLEEWRARKERLAQHTKEHGPPKKLRDRYGENVKVRSLE
jgi:hypothetical protein